MTGIQLTTAGDTVVEAIGNTASNAVSTAEGGGGGVSVAYVRAQASVGKSGEERQSVHVTVDGTKVVAGGDIELRVYNEGAALANIVRGTNISLGAVDVEELPTYGWYATGRRRQGPSRTDLRKRQRQHSFRGRHVRRERGAWHDDWHRL